jgi:hypothetical protein
MVDGVGSDGEVTDAGEAAIDVAADGAPSPSDLPVITEIDEDAGLPEGFLDAFAPEPDAIPDAVTPDVHAPTDGVEEVSETVGDVDAVADGLADVAEGEPDTFLSDCDNLGVASGWAGTFQGAIQYHLPESLSTLFNPLDGILIVGGALAFDIECVDSKLIVSGDMDGTANVSGEGEFPFLVKLAGYFNPQTGQLNATMVEGMVVIYEEVELYFSGDFTGTLAQCSDDAFIDQEACEAAGATWAPSATGPFTGEWTGQYEGTNFPAMDPNNEVEAFACPDGYACSWVATPTDDE